MQQKIQEAQTCAKAKDGILVGCLKYEKLSRKLCHLSAVFSSWVKIFFQGLYPIQKIGYPAKGKKSVPITSLQKLQEIIVLK